MGCSEPDVADGRHGQPPVDPPPPDTAPDAKLQQEDGERDHSRTDLKPCAHALLRGETVEVEGRSKENVLLGLRELHCTCFSQR